MTSRQGIIRGESLALAAEKGTITQAAANRVKTADVKVTAANGITLMSGAEAATPIYNEFENLTVQNTNEGTVALGNGGSKTWTVTFAEGSKATALTVHNFDDIASDTTTDNAMVLKGSVDVTDALSLQNDEGDLSSAMDVTVSRGALLKATGALANRRQCNAGG